MKFQGPFHSVHEVLIAENNKTGSLHQLRNDCFERFKYSKYLKIWINKFERNVLLIDSQDFMLHPSLYINKLQKELKLKQILTYKKLEIVENSIDDIIDKDTESLLEDYYSEDIKKFKNLVLRKNLRKIPKWLQEKP